MEPGHVHHFSSKYPRWYHLSTSVRLTSSKGNFLNPHWSNSTIVIQMFCIVLY